MKYHTGCDAHSRTCEFQHMDEDGVLGLTMRVNTSKEGLNNFLVHLDEPTTMTLEAGRNWWWLHEFFSDHPKVSEVNVVDPRRSRNIAKELSVISGYGRAKNDRIDSEMLAEQRRRELAPTINVPTEDQLKKRTVNRYRFMLVGNRTRHKNFIHSLLAMHGYKVKIDNLLLDSCLKEKTLKTFPLFIEKIVEQQLSQIHILNTQIAETEKTLDEILPASHPQIKTLITHPGIGIVLARIIYTEILDISYFKETKYLISYSCLAPIENESGGRKGSIKLNQHGNHYLKYAFVEAAHNARDNNKFRRKYDLDVKKHGKIIAKLNLARRIAKAVYWMLTRQESYKFDK